MSGATPSTPKILLLVFIHGFKGNDQTFSSFPSHLRAHLINALHPLTTPPSPSSSSNEPPSSSESSSASAPLRIHSAVYPQYETRGSLPTAVSDFRTWLENQVIDHEVQLGTASPTVSPAVAVVLVGHSMGGIVAAETLLESHGRGTVDDRKDNRGDGAENFAEEAATGQSDEQAQKEDGPRKEGGSGRGFGAGLGGERDGAAQGEKSSGLDGAGSNNGGSDGAEGGKRREKEERAERLGADLAWPRIVGILAFDTPYVGISPSVVAHNAEEKFQTGKQFYGAASALFAVGQKTFGNNANTSRSTDSTEPPGSKDTSSPKAALPAPAKPSEETPNSSGWGKKAALFGAGAGAIAAAAGAAAIGYKQRERIQAGWSTQRERIQQMSGWVSSHLQFVGCLARGEELKERLDRVFALRRERRVGFANCFTALGVAKGTGGEGDGGRRTFCAMPAQKDWRECWVQCENEKMGDEVSAHMQMFVPKENPGYYGMLETAKQFVLEWVPGEWREQRVAAPDDTSHA